MPRQAKLDRRWCRRQLSSRRLLACLAAAAPLLWLAPALADPQIAPMAWDDPILGTGLTPIQGDYDLPGGESLEGVECDVARVSFGCVIMNWPPVADLARLSYAQLRSNEGIRRRGAIGSQSLIEWVYIEITSYPGDHADGIQHEGGDSLSLIRHTYIKMNQAPGQTAGLFAADESHGHLQLEYVIFEGGPRGFVAACDGASTVALNHVYFINGSFSTAGYHLNAGMNTEPVCNGSGWTLTQWDDVWNADIVNGELVPTDQIPPPCGVPCIPVSQWGGGGDPADSDSDGVPDFEDSCSLDPELPDESGGCDSDLDGYGNGCDADMNNDGVVDGLDLLPFGIDLVAGVDGGSGSDLNCDGTVDGLDFPVLNKLLAETVKPGPSGIACAGYVPCQ